ncbi:MAG: hypothetical protein LC772_08240 [Chloroflexi bacterium]|nr:hypothetical protein [Chloroflexota bacterium]
MAILQIENDVILTIPETAYTRRAMGAILMNNQAGLAQTGVLLLPLLGFAMLLWRREQPGGPGLVAAAVLIAICCLVAVGQWALWWSTWRRVPFHWELRADGIYRGDRLWASWSGIAAARIHRAVLGSRVTWSALKLTASGSNPNLRWGSPYIPIDPCSVDEADLLTICRRYAGATRPTRTFRSVNPWLVRVVVALFILTLAATWAAARSLVAQS